MNYLKFKVSREVSRFLCRSVYKLYTVRAKNWVNFFFKEISFKEISFIMNL
jgi:hypothetical protein